MASESQAILIGVYATLAMDVFSTFTSSPQTTEINADTRAGTLMKWVYVGAAVAVGAGIVGAVANDSLTPLAITVAVAGGMLLLYRHARDAGLSSTEPGTED